MAAQNHVGNPFEFVIGKLVGGVTDAGRQRLPRVRDAARAEPLVRQVSARDLIACLRGGLDDFVAARDDVIFVAIIYPLAGLVLAAVAMQKALLPMVFPLLSGFALVGPLAAVGLLEISRRRERGEAVTWMSAAGVLKSPALPSIVQMGLILVGLLGAWLVTAFAISMIAFGAGSPPTVEIFLNEVFATGDGQRMMLIGMAAGFVFALVALAISVVSFPLLLDRQVDLDVAISTSLKVVAANPGTMALWGLIVAVALVLGSLPALAGLIVVVPVLGHATWRLYRKAVAPA